MSLLVSVIIPVYNVEKYLNECVDSVINQIYSNLEIILIDDGSYDKSGEICDYYASIDSRIIVVHKENGGLSEARNTGLMKSNGDYIYFLDSDDYIDHKTIYELINIAVKNNSDIVFFDAESFLDNGTSVSKIMEYNRKCDYGTSSGPEMIYKLYSAGDFYTAIPLMFYKKSFLDDNMMEFYHGILHEDNLFSVQAFINANVVTHLNKNLYRRRMRDESIMTMPFSARNFSGYLTCIRELSVLYKTLSENSPEKNFLSKFISSRSSLIVNEYFNLPINEQKELKEDYKELNQILREINYLDNNRLKRKLKHKMITCIYKKIRYR